MPARFKVKRCRRCKARTKHERDIEKKLDMGCGFMLGNFVLCVITLGLWLPFFLLLLGLGMINNGLAPMNVRYRCVQCGRA